MYDNNIRDLICAVNNRLVSNNMVFKMLESIVGDSKDDVIELWMHKASNARQSNNTDHRYILGLAVEKSLAVYDNEEYLYWKELCGKISETIESNRIGEGLYKKCDKELASLMSNFLQDYSYRASDILASERTYLMAASAIYDLSGSRAYASRLRGLAKQIHERTPLYIGVISRDANIEDIHRAVKSSIMLTGMDIYVNWVRYSRLVYLQYTLIRRAKEANLDNTVIAEAGLTDLLYSDRVNTEAESFIPGIKIKSTNMKQGIYKKVEAVGLIGETIKNIEKLGDKTTDEDISELANSVLALGRYLERDTSRDKFIRYARATVDLTLDSNMEKYVHLATQVVKAYCAEHRDEDLNLLRLLK